MLYYFHFFVQKLAIAVSMVVVALFIAVSHSNNQIDVAPVTRNIFVIIVTVMNQPFCPL